ncbi:VOC family protein [Actinocorallia libanotica]|uniref:VOC family protein n=1 Tax=Actinocorallia libanotica TaxID=46162 RepID=A0ABN1Q0Z2_9ACTN
MSRPAIYPIVPYRDLRGALTFLCDAFGFTTHFLVEGPGGGIEHVELALGDGGIIMPTRGNDPAAMWLCVRVDDLDAHHERAVRAGARIVDDLHETRHGSRDYSALDPAGHRWTFTTYDPYAPSADA